MQVQDCGRLPAPALSDDAVGVEVQDVEAVARAVAPAGEDGEGGRPGLLWGRVGVRDWVVAVGCQVARGV